MTTDEFQEKLKAVVDPYCYRISNKQHEFNKNTLKAAMSLIEFYSFCKEEGPEKIKKVVIEKTDVFNNIFTELLAVKTFKNFENFTTNLNELYSVLVNPKINLTIEGSANINVSNTGSLDKNVIPSTKLKSKFISTINTKLSYFAGESPPRKEVPLTIGRKKIDLSNVSANDRDPKPQEPPSPNSVKFKN